MNSAESLGALWSKAPSVGVGKRGFHYPSCWSFVFQLLSRSITVNYHLSATRAAPPMRIPSLCKALTAAAVGHAPATGHLLMNEDVPSHSTTMQPSQMGLAAIRSTTGRL